MYPHDPFVCKLIDEKKTEAGTFEEWIAQKFGNKLYETFFKTYTGKIWGITCDKIGMEFAGHISSEDPLGLDIRGIRQERKDSVQGG